MNGNVYIALILHSDIFLPKVLNPSIEEYFSDFPTIRKSYFDNDELATLNSSNLNILLDGLYGITSKLGGKAFFDEEGSSMFSQYIKDGRLSF